MKSHKLKIKTNYIKETLKIENNKNENKEILKIKN